ncbi:MAG: DNA-directed RNA polymerase subunit beta [Candidatus Magasanikbacteria bacterium GW2011_GWC2_40_17]|uniref:DNA-directed RNA polymerase subunit beta n=1 Tax=Candidatus Magasanikbacteria bacterium GW2011_GWA2_42_32 TaxID=1619039 RepID=A0A0G1A8G1_9BACT|nr:MAG: DNA-directed RNA polymerase subunit beta [Candidatus Magasanikbacteria bacterium GW2011_GWC2_40_17]KKS57337.1 MAG: DNA-directed RNA polymerase subunit beta [Candidatus Magasanikbacteria bacterium GW2011_GWA2_42_32]OGH85818.1 MAG: DNA-directed RNA polymerase subunit beta [Candidatus Magasanikbacteria bacterium RIFOXYB2_FULL_38_10]
MSVVYKDKIKPDIRVFKAVGFPITKLFYKKLKTKYKKIMSSSTNILKPRIHLREQEEVMDLPNLISVQKDSYDWFLKTGVRELFDEVSPIQDFTNRDLELYFGEYYLDAPKFDEIICRNRNITYEAALRVKARLTNKRTGESKEQEVFMGDFPVMTKTGTFIINGIERAVVSQLIRSAGVFFTSEIFRGHRYYGAKIIPNRGAWVEIETDSNNVIWCKVDRKRKAPITMLLRAFGFGSDEEIRKLFKDVDTHPQVRFIENTLAKDTSKDEDSGLIGIYQRIRPGDLATADNARSLIHAMFFNFDRYDFSAVGRYKFNQRFAVKEEIDVHDRRFRTLTKEDLATIIKEIIHLNITQEEADDIDHLGNRRVRAVGELVQNRLRVGLARMERIVKDRMSTMDVGALTPNKLINARPVMGVTREFFMSSQLSQFMDQTNPLAELEHKRRLSAMGPGGLSRDRAGFDVRDVHTTHYGRICPIATPEGPNIGLVTHLASYAKVNQFGFMETPFRKVLREVKNDSKLTEGEKLQEDVLDAKGKLVGKKDEKITKDLAKDLAKLDLEIVKVKPRVTKEIVWLNAFMEEKGTTTSANTLRDKEGYFIHDKAEVRKHGEPSFEDVTTIDYVDVAPNQIVSVATSCIPFLEHDDSVRALMGTNMQRQAVPCIAPEAPLVGTGMEKRAAMDSGHIFIAENDGVIAEVDGGKVQILEDGGGLRTFQLNKFVRSNASTCFNQHPVVTRGQRVKAGDILTDGPAISQDGELALGQNILVAFMIWDGYNFEDAIIISERLVQKDRFTSIHIENYTTDVRETKLGPELVTSDIPNVSEEKLKNLDSEGIIRIGAKVKSGDILVGKITPKGETELSAEEKLLRAIFGEKARDVRDSSLYLEHGEHGTVVDVKIFSAENGDKLPPGVIKSVQVSIADMRKIQVGDKMAGRHGNKGIVSKIVPVADMPFLADGTPVDIILSPLGIISRMNLGQIMETVLGSAANKFRYKVASPVLAGISEEKITEELKRAGYDPDGQAQLYDGRTGESFDHQSTIGYIYMLKLNHMVEDKIHQRSIGPYSLITQQPLGGKAQFGGQRFGEMEVWALEGYGAAATLQEILTIKSDDVAGRAKAYESIIKGEPITRLAIPESFNVLVRELKGLGLDVELLKKREGKKEVEYDVVKEGAEEEILKQEEKN